MTASLTSEQALILNRYLRSTHEHGRVRDGLWVTLVISGDRPGAVIGMETEAPEFTEEDFHRLCTLFGLVREHSVGNDWFICRDEDRLELLPTSAKWSNEYHVEMGNFLGYPDRVVAAYLRDDLTPLSPFPYLQRGRLSLNELAYLAFTPYLPCLTLSGVEHEIEIGKQRSEQIEKRGERWNLRVLRQMSGTAYQLQRTRLATALSTLSFGP